MIEVPLPDRAAPDGGAWTPGRPQALGATLGDGGVNFAVFSEHATAIELCLFDASGTRELRRLPLFGPEDGVFCGWLAQDAAGLVYGYRAHGEHAPQHGHRFNPNKLLLDPWAREILGHFAWRPEHHGYPLGHADGPLALDERDNAAVALKARVAAAPSHRPRPGPRLPAAQVVLYELHVKGFSMQLPGVPDSLRGRFAALAHPAAIAHFKRLGVTTLSLLPVHYHLDEPLLPPGKTNYWGYNTLGFFCPDPRFAVHGDDPTAVNDEFRDMVDALHAAGLEVVLDVVFNHTPEGNEWGPTLSFRGLDQASWYRVDEGGGLANYSACGNTLNLAHPRVAHFVIECLRYWVLEMGVDGFRFDLAAVLGRGTAGEFSADAPFFQALLADPVLAQARLIAEPWDAGPQGYRLGQFPGRFLEWNDRFRDALRGFWLRRGGITRREFAQRFAGSPDLFGAARAPTASVNYVAVHDGFTLADTLAYSHKHNRDNGEDNRDGRDDELCANQGAEGASDDPAIKAQRLRLRHALLSSLLLAQGTPMLCAGDEFGNSQQGNNNAWVQDNPCGWLAWDRAEAATLDLVARLLALRRDEPLLRPAERSTALQWLNLDDPAQVLACTLAAAAGGASWLLAFNPEANALPLALPPGVWQLQFDSSAAPAQALQATLGMDVAAQSLSLLRRLGA